MVSFPLRKVTVSFMVLPRLALRFIVSIVLLQVISIWVCLAFFLSKLIDTSISQILWLDDL